jgi:hypothetical protein
MERAMSNWSAIEAADDEMGMGTVPIREGVIKVFSRTSGLRLGLLIHAPEMGEPPWIVETPAGGTYHETWEEALENLEENKREFRLAVELEYAEPIDRPLRKNDVAMWDAAERFLVNDLAARRESLEPAGMRLKRIRVGAVEREV